MNKILAYYISFLLLSLLVLFPTMTTASNINIMPDRTIKLPKTKDTVYHLLLKVSDITGLLFIYDSKIIDNEKVTTIKKGNYTIEEAIRLIVDNTELEVSQVGNHILITLPATHKKVTAPTIIEKKKTHFIIEGTLVDKQTKEPIEGGTINVQNTSIGSVSNANGEFRLIIPDSLQSSKIIFSHLGYTPEKLDASLIAGRKSNIGLEAKVIPLQEVIVRIANPIRLLREMQQNIRINYPHDPVYLTSFYREGIERKSKFVSLSEAIFKIYKSSYLINANSDQVKLLKMRNISNQLEKDTVITKMKAGINSSLMLDVIKTMPDFLNPDDENNLY
ncbi:MAG: STN and carboxypeptidase regulatory-like domain-containing protein, partial [Bacteroidaceae bacterium]|nr:STN and carboxypeptidase regulatory-like domain-containing protein [Bacteroidaceae bacterium]